MPQGLSVNRVVNVTVNLAPPAPQAQDIDSCLVLGTSSVIDVAQRIREYASIEEVATDFSTTSEEYLSAVLWFEQLPQPIQLLIGRWAQTATNALLVGGPVSVANQAISAWTAITTGGFLATINGAFYAIGSLNFSAQTNLNGVASTIQTALNSAVAGSTCVWDANYDVFRITGGGTAGTGSTIGFLEAPTAVGNAAFSGNPTASDTITFNGTAITFVTSGATGNQVNIGGSLSVTLASLLTLLSGSSDTQLVKFRYAVVGSTLYVKAATPGAGGNALTLAKSSTVITLSGATLAGGSATDITTMLAMRSTSSGAYVAQGVDAETALEAVTALDIDFGTQWYGLTIPAAVDADHLAVAAYIEASSISHYYGVTTQEGGVLVSNDTSNIAYQLSQLAYNSTCVQYSSTNPYAVMSYLARILTTDWRANNSTITLKFKQEPGIVAETLNSTQANAAEGNHANVFVVYNNDTAIIEQGVSTSGQYTDTIVGLDWLKGEMQNDLYTALYVSPTKIPMTDAGNHVLATVIETTCDKGVNNGLIGPGRWNVGGFGALKQNDNLPKGYYVFQPLVASMSAADRAARKSVPFQVAVNLAGAIHSVNVSILVNS